MTMTPEKAQALLDGATPGPWHYRPHKYDDWGVVRGGVFNEKWGGYPHLAQVRDPAKLHDDTLCQHRARGEDPWEGNARLVADAPDLARAYIAQAAELTRLRARIEAFGHALQHIDAMDPEARMISGVSADAARGLVLRMGEVARAARSAYEETGK